MATPNQPQQQQFDVHKFFLTTSSPPPPHTTATQNPSLMLPPPSTIPSSSYPPPTGPHPHFPFQYPQQFHHFPPPFLSPHEPNPNPNHFPLPNVHPQRSLSYPTPPLSPSPRNNSGAEIMALLRPPPANQDPPPTPPPVPQQQQQQQLPPVLPGPLGGPVRMPSSKMPKGRRVSGDSVVYDVDVRLQGEARPQLEVTPITRYTSDPQLCLGRQIAVNKSYICYGLKQGSIRILNINTALRSLFRTQSQRVTDMAFFAEDVHLLASAGIDGRINVWKISEGPDEEDKPQITGKTVIAIQILGEGEIKSPRVCWHCYKQEILVVGIGRSVLRIDGNKVGKGDTYSSEAPIQCHVCKLVDGIQLVGKHDGEVTDLSICQWMTTRLVSASVDGTIKIWEDLKASPLVVLRPHDGLPVCSATFLTSTDRPDHIILVTAGPQNRELKIWVSSREEGWFLPGDADSLNCTQKLELKISSETRIEEAFFNQVVALSQVGLLLLANAKRNAIYAIHFDYGPNPAATHMDYISEFTVTMPILSLTGKSDVMNGQSVAHIYCVQTQAIQQYTLGLCQCLPPVLDHDVLEKSDSSVPHEVSSEGFTALDSRGSKFSDVLLSSTSADTATSQDIPSPNMDSRPANLAPPGSDADIACVPSSPLPPRSKFTEISVVQSIPPPDQDVNQTVIVYSVDQHMDTIHANLSSRDGETRNDVKRVAQDDNSNALNSPVVFKVPTHLITPSEILMGVASSEIANSKERKTDDEANIQDVVVSNDSNAEVDVKVVGQTSSGCNNEFGLWGVPKGLVLENKEKTFCSQATVGVEISRECWATSDAANNVEELQQIDGVDTTELRPQTSHADEEDVQDSAKHLSGSESVHVIAPQLTSPTTKGKKQKGKNSQAAGPFSLPAPFNLTSSPNEQCGTSGLSIEAAFPQIMAIQDMLTQVMTTQKEMQKQMSNMVAVPVSKECRRLEAALGRTIEKAVKANNDALWARFQEENAKNEKYMRDRTQQITSLISNFINKDLVTMLEKAVKKELTSIGSSVVRTISPAIEKTISSSISESFQRGVGDKAVNQLDKSVNTKLEATVARQIQAQFQTTGRQALQDALRIGLETSVVPAFEMSCKGMFEQMDATFRKGMVEHTTAAQEHLDTAHSSLAIALREAINTASALAQNLGGELADGQRKLLAFAAAGANSGAANPLVAQLSNGPLANFHEKVETHLDPTKELTRFITEQKYEEAFTIALQRSDVSLVSWLCSQVDLRGILSNVSLPLSQGVLLALLQQLAYDINTNTAQKLSWMTDVAAVVNPTDQMIAVHARPILDQVYKIIIQLRSLPTTTGTEMATIRILLHFINAIFTKM